jgi:hypothetical protein
LPGKGGTAENLPARTVCDGDRTMMVDSREVLTRLGEVLIEKIEAKKTNGGNLHLTVQDIYYDLVPFYSYQKELGIECVFDYERALLQLLAGQGGVVELESLAEKQKLEKHVNSFRIDPSVLRDFLTAGVRVCSPAG